METSDTARGGSLAFVVSPYLVAATVAALGALVLAGSGGFPLLPAVVIAALTAGWTAAWSP
jgi:hypothetical protein